jgi:putative oxidoreductase
LRFLDRLQPLGLVVLRCALGVIMIAHGKVKLFGGMHDFTGLVAQIGMPHWMAYLAAFTEFVGGILLIAGLGTRFVGIAMTIEMSVAIAKVHWSHGLKGPGGFEFPLALAAIAFSLIWTGAGAISLDWLFGKKG